MLVGVDEAGRGCVIGPMIIAAVTDSPDLYSLKLKDSKLLSRSRRSFLFTEINKVSQSAVVKITALKLNELMSKMSLNEIELIYMAHAVNKLLSKNNISKVYFDCPETNTKTFVRKIKVKLKKNVKIIAEHKADTNYPVVSAASIIAKVTRDNEIEKIKKIVDFDFNSGYSSDEITIKYLEKNFNNPLFEPFIRKKWITYRRLADKKQTKLF